MLLLYYGLLICDVIASQLPLGHQSACANQIHDNYQLTTVMSLTYNGFYMSCDGCQSATFMSSIYDDI